MDTLRKKTLNTSLAYRLVFFYNGKWIIAYLDDASRLITGYGVFDEATSENAIKVLKEAIIMVNSNDQNPQRVLVLCFCRRKLNEYLNSRISC